MTAKQALRLVMAQLAVTVLLSMVLLVSGLLAGGPPDTVMAYSGLTGGLIATTANAWFAHKVFNHRNMEEPAKVLRSFYRGEINKLLLTGALFITAFVLLEPVSGAALIAVYFVVHMTPFVLSMVSNNTH